MPHTTNRFNFNDDLVDSINSLILLSSRDKYPSQSINDVTFQKSRYFTSNLIEAVALKQFIWPVFIPNVNPRNNHLILNDGTNNFTITLVENWYGFSEFATQFQTQLNAAGSTSGPFTVAVNTVNLPAGGTPEARFYTITAAGTAFTMTVSDIEAQSLFGITTFTTPTNVLVTSYTSIDYTKFYDVVSNSLHQNTVRDESSSLGTSDVLARIDLRFPDTNFSNPILTQMMSLQTPKKIKFDTTSGLGEIDIKIYDEFGKLIYLPTGADNVAWSAVVETYNKPFRA